MQINPINNTISFSRRHKKNHIPRNIPTSNVNPHPTTPPPAPPGTNMGVLNVRPRTKEEILAEKMQRVQGSNLEIHKASDFYIKRAQELQKEAQQCLIVAKDMYEKIKESGVHGFKYDGISYRMFTKRGKYYVGNPRDVLSHKYQPSQSYEINKKTGKLVSYTRDKSKQEQNSATVFNFKDGKLISCEVGKHGDLISERYSFEDGVLKSIELFVKGEKKNYSATRKFDYYYGGILKSYHRDYSKDGKSEKAQYAYFYNSSTEAPFGFASSWQKDDVDLWSAKECMYINPDGSANYFTNFHKDGPVITKDEFHFIPLKD